MRKTLVVLTLVVLTVLLLAAPGLVAAKGGSPQLFSLTGKITNLDYEAEDAITVLVDSGNRFVHSSVGKEVEVLVDDTTKYWQCTDEHLGEGPDPIQYDDLQTGDAIFIQGSYSEGEDPFTATKVILDRPVE